MLTWLDGEEQREAEVIINNVTVYSDGTQESLVYEVTLETEQMPDAQMAFVSLFVYSNRDCTPANWKPKAHSAGCELRDQDLTGANLQGVNLCNTLQIGANLFGVILNDTDLTDARFCGTTCPDGTVSDMFLLSDRCSF